MTEIHVIPSNAKLKRKAVVLVNTDTETAFKFISSSEKLGEWLKKSPPIPGAKSVEILEGPYNFVGAKRIVHFEDGDTAQEELISYHPSSNYAYKISSFSNFLGKLSNAAYGQIWFDQLDNQTRITWEYYFTYRSVVARIGLSLFLIIGYKRFMKNSLLHAKTVLEHKNN